MTTPTPALTAPVFEESHGRSIGYQRGCRCDRCVGWRRDYDRKRYRRLHPDHDISEAEVRRRWPHVVAAIEAAAVARHVRDTGCGGIREALAGLYEHGHFAGHNCANDQPSWRDRCPVAAARAALAAPAADASASDALAASPEACAREGCGRSLADHYTAEPFAIDCPGYQPATASAAATSEEGGE